MPTSCATSAATPSTRRRCASWTSSACSTTFLRAPAPAPRGDRRLVRRQARPARRLPRPAGALRVHRDDAAVGVPRLPRRRGAEAADVHVAHARRGHRPDRGGADASSACAARRPTATSRSAPSCTVGCDGRHSTVRAAAGLAVEDLGAPIDVLWFRVRRDPAELDTSLARIAPGHFVVTIDRGDYWQCAFVIAKGGAEALRQRPIEEFRAQVVEAGPVLAAHIAEDVRSLGRRQAAHRRRRSPDAVVEAGPALHRRCGARDVADRRRRHQPGDPGRGRRGQPARREAARRNRSPTTTSTRCASAASGRPRRRRRRRSASRTTCSCRCSAAPTPRSRCRCRCASSPRVPALQRLMARLLGMGVRPEHVRSPAV